MLDYSIIGLIFIINLLIYLLFTIPLDLLTYVQRTNDSKENFSPKVKIDIFTILVFSTTIFMWILYVSVPLDVLFGTNFFYIPLFIKPEFIILTLQLLGIALVFLGTLIAGCGRITRGKRAFSWGVPTKLEKRGMYRFIRHPLYASYCYYYIGFFLILQSLIISFLLLGVLGYYKLSIYEEKILIEHFGEEYIDYQKKVGRFFPRLI